MCGHALIMPGRWFMVYVTFSPIFQVSKFIPYQLEVEVCHFKHRKGHTEMKTKHQNQIDIKIKGQTVLVSAPHQSFSPPGLFRLTFTTSSALKEEAGDRATLLYFPRAQSIFASDFELA